MHPVGEHEGVRERPVEGYRILYAVVPEMTLTAPEVCLTFPSTNGPGFVALLDRCACDGVGIVLAENASRFARVLAVQLTGHALLRARGIELVPVDVPTYFTDPTPTRRDGPTNPRCCQPIREGQPRREATATLASASGQRPAGAREGSQSRPRR